MGEILKRVAFWNRMSHINSVERESHINHRMRAEEFCKFHGWELVKEYSLMEVPGGKVREHPAYYEYRADVRAGRIDALLVTSIKRFARKVSILVEEIQFLKDHGVDFIAINDNVDTTTPYGRFFFHLISALAELESDEVSERIRLSIKPRAERGLPLGGKCPPGYRWDKRQLVIDEERAPAIRRVFETFVETRNLAPTCRRLTEAGIFAEKGLFTNTTLRRLLSNTVYVGRHLKNYSGSKAGKRFWKDAKDHVVIDCPRLIDDGLWNNTQALLARISTSQPPKVKQNHYLLSGLLSCPCGGKFYGVTYRDEKWSKYVCKACAKRVKLALVDKAVLDLLKDVILRADYLEARIKEIDPSVDIVQKAYDLANLIQIADNETKNILLKTLIKRIDVDGTDINVVIRMIPQIEVPLSHVRTSKVAGESVRFETVYLFPGNPQDCLEFSHKVSFAPPAISEENLAQRVKAARGRLKLLQVEVDTIAGLSETSCCRFETGRAVPNKTSLKKLAKALRVSEDWLLWGNAGSLAARVREFRNRLGITQAELSRRSGRDRKFVNEIERGAVTAPTQEKLKRLSRALNVPLEELCPGGVPWRR